MLTPTLQAAIRPFRPFGNTPAISLTRDLPQGVDADVLLFECEDVRHILYTCHAEQDFPDRKLDVTACNADENVIARNALLLALILDGREAGSSEKMWNIFFHMYLDESDMKLLEAQAKKLVAVSEDLGQWHASSYGSTLRFGDAGTLSAVRSVWSQHVAAVDAKDSTEYKNRFESARGKSQAFKDRVWGTQGLAHTGTRSSAPLSFQMTGDMIASTERYWDTGFSNHHPPGTAVLPNPMFSVAMSDAIPLAFPSDPLLGFHLAAAHATLTQLSPLRLTGQASGEPAIFDAAQLQFRLWTDAFRRAAARVTVRYVSAHCFSFCHTLQYNIDTGETNAHWYRHEHGFQALELAGSEYGKQGETPRKFDVIDTSNFSDRHGALGVLISAGPLLKNKPSSSLYTKLVPPGLNSRSEAFDDILCGYTKALSLLLGLAPIEYWTNNTIESYSDDFVAVTLDGGSQTGKETHSQVAWKHDKCVAGSNPPPGKLLVKPEDLANLAYRAYLNMFEHENMLKMADDMESGSDLPFPNAHTKYHRGTLVALVKIICKSVRTDAEEVGRCLFGKLSTDQSRLLTFAHMPSFEFEMIESGLRTEEPVPSTDSTAGDSNAPFCKWKSLPTAVAVTLVIPPSRWKPIYGIALKRDMGLGGFALDGNLRSGGTNKHAWHSMYSDVQVAFGTVSTRGSRDDDGFTVLVDEDKNSWNGNSPLVVSFYASSWALRTDIPNTLVAVTLQHAAKNIREFRTAVNSAMPILSIYDTPLLDEEHVFISKHPPGQTSYFIVGGTLPPTGVEELAVSTPSPQAYFAANFDERTLHFLSLTGHIDITSDKGKQLLNDKVPITLHEASPFTINIVFGNSALVLPVHFPIPILKDLTKTRIARKSGYIELIAPFAEASTNRCLDSYVFPTIRSESGLPITLNIPHLSLDTLPILDVDNKDDLLFFTMLASCTLSNRERSLRNATFAGPAPTSDDSPLSPLPRVNFKESLFTMCMLSSGLQGGQTGLFALSKPKAGGIHMLVFVSAIRLDATAAGVVLDTAVLPFSREMLEGGEAGELKDFLLLLRTLECCTLTVDDDELRLWKQLLPAYVERCRTWEHTSACEYARPGAAVPLSLEDGGRVLCSCGRGRMPDGYVAVPEWDTASKFCTRAAIGLAYACPFVEEVVDPALPGIIASKNDAFWQRGPGRRPSGRPGGGKRGANSLAGLAGEACWSCGRTRANKPGGGQLKKCMRCLKARYCSVECQKDDWPTKHRFECIMAEENQGVVSYLGLE
ncbi:hypothetical protein B0H67DRAFT_595921 [Lasiosphaeris hirsuta]|uniref:MYND-type domain-containing protein n=1 Tax=Lasiosphaeris hirsuta TaxID=260670 RepID=A0AA40B894_9PEZI|nr:hypothetical protein B0H67DRAFT_595921 [Lasiosphaeris hirsuta]